MTDREEEEARQEAERRKNAIGDDSEACLPE